MILLNLDWEYVQSVALLITGINKIWFNDFIIILILLIY